MTTAPDPAARHRVAFQPGLSRLCPSTRSVRRPLWRFFNQRDRLAWSAFAASAVFVRASPASAAVIARGEIGKSGRDLCTVGAIGPPISSDRANADRAGRCAASDPRERCGESNCLRDLKGLDPLPEASGLGCGQNLRALARGTAASVQVTPRKSLARSSRRCLSRRATSSLSAASRVATLAPPKHQTAHSHRFPGARHYPSLPVAARISAIARRVV